jgi:aldose 1-epimerase
MQIKKRLFADVVPSVSFQSQFQNINKISPEDLPIYCYELINPATNTSVVITSFGGTILSIRTPDKNGTVEEITLCFKSLNELNHPTVHPFYGALIGRYANRIAKGIFETESGTHQLATNNGPNHLHGGRVGFDKKIWKEVSFTVDESCVRLELEHFSPHLEENYPGNLTVRLFFIE